jgi:hypothetical protein
MKSKYFSNDFRNKKNTGFFIRVTFLHYYGFKTILIVTDHNGHSRILRIHSPNPAKMSEAAVVFHNFSETLLLCLITSQYSLP